MVEWGKGATDGAIESTEDCKVYNVYTENIKVEETRRQGWEKNKGGAGSGHKCVWASENKGNPRVH